jgi:hypothetical protein
MTARLQAATTSNRLVVLLYDTKAGHAGGRSLTKVIEDTTMEMAFLARELGMTVPRAAWSPSAFSTVDTRLGRLVLPSNAAS